MVGLNRWTDGIPSPLLGGDDGGIFKVDDVGRTPTRSTASTQARADPRRRPGPRPRSTALKDAARERRSR